MTKTQTLTEKFIADTADGESQYNALISRLMLDPDLAKDHPTMSIATQTMVLLSLARISVSRFVRSYYDSPDSNKSSANEMLQFYARMTSLGIVSSDMAEKLAGFAAMEDLLALADNAAKGQAPIPAKEQADLMAMFGIKPKGN